MLLGDGRRTVFCSSLSYQTPNPFLRSSPFTNHESPNTAHIGSAFGTLLWDDRLEAMRGTYKLAKPEVSPIGPYQGSGFVFVSNSPSSGL